MTVKYRNHAFEPPKPRLWKFGGLWLCATPASRGSRRIGAGTTPAKAYAQWQAGNFVLVDV